MSDMPPDVRIVEVEPKRRKVSYVGAPAWPTAWKHL